MLLFFKKKNAGGKPIWLCVELNDYHRLKAFLRAFKIALRSLNHRLSN